MYFVVIVQRLLGFVVTYFLVRVLSQGQYAEYSLIISYLALLSAFSLPGIGNALMQSTARGFNSFYPKAQKIMFAGSLLAGTGLLLFAYAHKNATDYSDVLRLGLIAAALLYPFYRGLTVWQNRLSGLKKFRHISFLEGMASIVTNLVIIYLLIGYDVTDYLPLIVAYILIPALLNIAMSVHGFWSVAKEEKREEKDDMVSYGLKTSFFAGIHTVALRLDGFLLFYLISPEVMALYTVANKIPELLRSVTQTLGTILAPRFAQSPFLTAEINKAITLFSLGFGGAIIIATFTIYPLFMTFLFGEMYQEAILYSQVIMCSLIIGNVANLNFRFIRSHKDSKNYKNVTLIISAVRILAVVALVPFIGIWGAIASVFLYRIAMLVIVKYIIKKEYSAPVKAD